MAARVFITLAAAISLLLFGGAAGLLLAVTDEQGPTPTAVDIGFSQDMSLHHQQAVTMATLARERATNPQIRQLAFDIETNQRDQVGRMQGWLSLWGQPPQAAGAPMQWMEGGHGSHGHSGHNGHGGHQKDKQPAGGNSAHMPGMATRAELGQLRAAQGPAFDTLFLQLMLRHHQGGTGMATYARDNAAVGPVVNLANNILTHQTGESRQLQQMLSAQRAKPLPMN